MILEYVYIIGFIGVFVMGLLIGLLVGYALGLGEKARLLKLAETEGIVVEIKKGQETDPLWVNGDTL